MLLNKLKRSLPEFSVGIEDSAVRERESVKRLISQLFGGAKKQRQGRREGCFVHRGRSAPRPVDPLARRTSERYNIASFREGLIWDLRCQELDTLRIVV
jgi:hypothetical protein